APSAGDDAVNMPKNGTLNMSAPGVLNSVIDVDGDPLTAILVTSPTSGTLTLNANGSYRYTPNTNFSGTDSFSFKANDALLDSNTATITITVNASNTAPVATDDAYSINEDTMLTDAAPGVLG